MVGEVGWKRSGVHYFRTVFQGASDVNKGDGRLEDPDRLSHVDDEKVWAVEGKDAEVGAGE